MKLTADTVYGFTNSLLISRFDNPRPTPYFHTLLWEAMCSDNRQVAIAAPRGHAKSTAVTHSYVLTNICFKLKRFIVLVSDTESQAINFLNDIKAEVLENEELRNLFGIVPKLEKEREADIIIKFDDGSETRVTVRGSEQRVRGLKWRSMRPDLIVCDDLENDEIVMNEDRREKFRNWFFKALLPIGGENTDIRVVGTILHMDSLLERLMTEMGDKTIESTPLMDYSTVGGDWKSIRFRAHNEDFSQILWPERFDIEFFKKKRREYIRQGMPEGYSQEYLNYPIDTSTAFFRERDFLPLKNDGSPLSFYVAADLAISEKKRNAFTVFVVAAVNSEGKLKFKEVIRFRGDSLEIIDEMFRLQNIYKPELFFVEEENIARSLGPVLNKEMRERGVFLNIKTMPPTKDKIQRARPLQARMRAGMVEFDKEADWFPPFQQELLQFPRGVYKDQVDAAAWIALGLDNIVEAPTAKDLEDQEYSREFEESYDFMDTGRNSWTGY